MSTLTHGGPMIELLEISVNLDMKKISRDKMLGEIPSNLLVGIYTNMVRTRALDEKVKEMINRGHSISEHSTLGQEASPIAACAALAPSDYMMPYHRGWAWALGKGMDPKPLLAEAMGKKTGYCKGKGGPHLGCYELGILGRSGIQGAHLPIAAGVGLGIKLQKMDKVCMTFFGNGASNTGNFHEGLNLAGVWQVPVIYLCENNLYQITCTVAETTACEDIAVRALGYGMPGYVVDGNDAVAVYYVSKLAVERARRGEGPTLIETKTYRWEGHNLIDRSHLGGYRSVEEIEEWKQKDPITLLERDLLGLGTLSADKVESIRVHAVAEMEEAAQYAIDSPYPEREDYYTDVFAG